VDGSLGTISHTAYSPANALSDLNPFHTFYVADQPGIGSPVAIIEITPRQDCCWLRSSNLTVEVVTNNSMVSWGGQFNVRPLGSPSAFNVSLSPFSLRLSAPAYFLINFMQIFAFSLASNVNRLLAQGKISQSPIVGPVAAISVGIVQGTPLLDLEYTEDSACDTDMNVVMTGAGHFVEVQGTAEGAAFSRADMDALLNLAEKGIVELMALQQQALAQALPAA
jgi:hypothetical protein